MTFLKEREEVGGEILWWIALANDYRGALRRNGGNRPTIVFLILEVAFATGPGPSLPPARLST